MATIKSFTDLQQSKVLEEILPLESADMSYYIWKDDGHLMSPVPFVLDGTEVKEDGMFEYIFCWSLAALLDVLKDYTLQTDIDGTVFVVCESKKPVVSDSYDNPVDACYQMIIRLNELNLL